MPETFANETAVPVDDDTAARFAPLPSRPLDDEDETPADPLDDNPRYLVLPNFQSHFCKDDRDIAVYLPEAYLAEPDRRFPVFYLHDGQNLFDPRTAYSAGNTWRAHTTADALAEAGLIEPVILVGVANTGIARMAEYTPTRNFRMGGGEGGRYGRLLVDELKPLIDRTFRTLPHCENTALGGSSLGGLITLALGLDYPAVFGKLAIMSPSVWWDHRSLLALVNEAAPTAKPTAKIWLDMGTAEGLRHLRDADLLHQRLLQRGWREGVDLCYLRVDGGLHTESAWADRFDQTLRFLFPPR